MKCGEAHPDIAGMTCRDSSALEAHREHWGLDAKLKRTYWLNESYVEPVHRAGVTKQDLEDIAAGIPKDSVRPVDVVENTPGKVHRDDPKTSNAAAHKVTTGNHRGRILMYLAQVDGEGATDYELWEKTGGARPHVAGTRREELEAMKLCVRTNRTRPTDTGNEALVHVITELGRTVAAVLGGS